MDFGNLYVIVTEESSSQGAILETLKKKKAMIVFCRLSQEKIGELLKGDTGLKYNSCPNGNQLDINIVNSVVWEQVLAEKKRAE